MSVLVCGIDGWDLSLADYFEHPFWESIRDEFAVATIPEPEPIADGEVSHASSPRLWGELFTGVEAYRAGPLGFWEKITESGKVQRADVSRDWIYEHKCEKLVDRRDVLAPPLWEQAARAGYSIGTTCAWFSYPLPDQLMELIEEQGKWALSDFPFPMESEYLDDDRVAYPLAAYPDDGFLAEVGQGMRVPEMVERDPTGLYEQLLAQDEDRYRYTVDRLKEYGSPDLCLVYTRSTDGLAHQFIGEQTDREQFPEHLTDGVENFRSVYETNFDGIQSVWEAGEFDHLLLGGDHGVGVEFDADDEPYFSPDPEAHSWPAEWVMLSPEISAGVDLRATYPDITPTALDLLGVSLGDVGSEFDGASLVGQANREVKLRDLGYLP